MSAEDYNNWIEANQQYLNTHLARVRGYLEHQFDTPAKDDSLEVNQESDADRAQLNTTDTVHDPGLETESVDVFSALDRICALFSLSPFERDVLLLCAGVELDSTFALACSAAQGEGNRGLPTFSLALAALPDPHWSALTPNGPLRHWRLIEIATADSLTNSPVRIDERILHYLTGINHLDDRLKGLVKPCLSVRESSSSYHSLSEKIQQVWSDGQENTVPPAIHLCGSNQSTRRSILAEACEVMGMTLHEIKATDIPTSPAEREALARLWARESSLLGSALLVDGQGLEQTTNKSSLSNFLEFLPWPYAISSNDQLYLERSHAIRFDVPSLATQDQMILWKQVLGNDAQELNGHINQVTSQFRLDAQDIYQIGTQVRLNGAEKTDEDFVRELWDTCRRQARAHLDNLAQRIEPNATWEDLVLPAPQTQTLRDIASHVRHRTKVYETWGFASKGPRGLGISALFAGPSGTGKTMAAEILAGELGVDLFRIDLSQVVSKYIGETEKNLRRVFDAAEGSGALLLFDEADALFGKRSEVKDSHDRFANIEISYLLQRMESYQGLAILTTNMKDSMDPAFLRRIRFVVRFPFPNAEQRAEIWRRIFPDQTPTESLDPIRLGQLTITGGHIRNIALNASFIAADQADAVNPTHILQAARSEYMKLEKTLTEPETRGWS